MMWRYMLMLKLVLRRPLTTSHLPCLTNWAFYGYMVQQRRTDIWILRWFSQCRSPMPNFWGCTPRGYDPKFELGRDFCTMHLPPIFIILCLLFRKLSCWQTDRQTPLKTSNAFHYATMLVIYNFILCTFERSSGSASFRCFPFGHFHLYCIIIWSVGYV